MTKKSVEDSIEVKRTIDGINFRNEKSDKIDHLSVDNMAAKKQSLITFRHVTDSRKRKDSKLLQILLMQIENCI